jgi:hypothetical protein
MNDEAWWFSLNETKAYPILNDEFKIKDYFNLNTKIWFTILIENKYWKTKWFNFNNEK